MPSYNSERGVWTPAKEKGIVKKVSQDGSVDYEVYEGPDRAAQEQLKTAGVPHFGQDAKRDPEIIMRARTLNMTVDEYLKLNEPMTSEQVKAEENKKNRVVKHDERNPKRGVQPPQTGPIAGGFGELPA